MMNDEQSATKDKVIISGIDSDVHNLLNSIEAQKSAYDKFLSIANAEYSPNFNIFELCGINIGEVHFCSIIAELLNPLDSAKHGQGDKFLKKFIKLLSVDSVHVQQKFDDIVTEKLTNENRRIDIFLESKNDFAIGIEAKIWATDQNNQLKHYNQYLQDNYSAYRLIYLTPNGKKPSPESIPEDDANKLIEVNKLILMSYGELIEWLKDCKGVSKSKRVDFFIDELIRSIQRQYLGVVDMTESEIIKNAIVNTDKSLTAAFQISHLIGTVKGELLLVFTQQLNEAFLRKYPEWRVDISESWTSKWHGFNVSKHFKSSYTISFTFDSADLNNLITGICGNNVLKSSDPENWNMIFSAFKNSFGNGKSSNTWPWYIEIDRFKSEARVKTKWGDDIETWVKLLNGDMVKDFIVIFEAIRTAAEENNLTDFFDMK